MTCQEFNYGGCLGNGNRFSSLEECSSICLNKEELFPNENVTALSHIGMTSLCLFLFSLINIVCLFM